MFTYVPVNVISFAEPEQDASAPTLLAPNNRAAAWA